MRILVGDIHTEWALLEKMIERHNLSDCEMICVGDFGIYDYEEQKGVLENLNGFFVTKNILFRTIRGNHDLSAVWTDPQKYDLTNIKFIPDYTIETFQNEKWLFIGGAISIDRYWRWVQNDFHDDNEKLVYQKVEEKIDVLVSHTAPTKIGFTVTQAKKGFFKKCFEKDLLLEKDLLDERKLMDQISQEVNPKKHYCGHFHCHMTIIDEEREINVLDILEFKEHQTL